MNDRTGCERVLARMDVNLDGGLSPIDEARDAGHLEVCGACGLEWERRQETLSLARGAFASDDDFAPALASVSSALRQRLANARPARPARAPLRLVDRPLLVGAVTAAAAVLLLLALNVFGVVPELTQIAQPELPHFEVTLPTSGSSLLEGLGRSPFTGGLR